MSMKAEGALVVLTLVTVLFRQELHLEWAVCSVAKALYVYALNSICAREAIVTT